MPRWLVLLGTGLVAGVVGTVVVQERYLPERLSAAESAALREAYERAESERQRLDGELQATAARLQTTQADHQRLTGERDADRRTVTELRGTVAALAAALPPDPRGGRVQVRAATIRAKSGQLQYDLVLSRGGAADKPLSAVLQLVLDGQPANGGEARVKPQPVELTLDNVESVRGALPLPEGFEPRLATVQVLDRADGNAFGMRVIHVK
ncbi:hypothetical protein [Aquabacterium sp. J223]|uniref:hypothetical protein n=1 Tax=Aquabacterium sp. J223 TaxID=2898431 RepID=UPI0021AE267E|nr:hypothetical protein [Aquabacterium sp. J223]UUX95610.1 hypothetical protein LRS07_20810 [Aquabacterium sp. J223]